MYKVSLFATVATGVLLCATQAMAGGGISVPMPPMTQSIDANGINLMTGFGTFQHPDFGIGNGDAMLARSYTHSWSDEHDNFYGTLYLYGPINMGNPFGGVYSYDGRTGRFATDETVGLADIQLNGPETTDGYLNPPNKSIINGYVEWGGKRLTFVTPQQPGNPDVATGPMIITLTDETGTRVQYLHTAAPGQVSGDWMYPYPGPWTYTLGGLATKIYRPSGEIVTMNYDGDILRSVVSSFGYMLKYDYPSAFTTKITAINLSSEYCAPLATTCSLIKTWPSMQASAMTTVTTTPANSLSFTNGFTNALGQTYYIGHNRFQYPSTRAISITYPGTSVWHEAPETITGSVGNSGGMGRSYEDYYDDPSNPTSGLPDSDMTCTNFDPNLCIDGNFTVVNGQGTWTYNLYSRRNYYDPPNAMVNTPGFDNGTMTVTDPLGKVKTIKSVNRTQGLGRVITSATDENGKTTNYEYSDPYNGKLTKVTYPEGNYSKFTYDDRGNLTEHRDVAKPGSGIADSVWTAGYDTTCANYVTCNQPNWVRDPNGNTSPNTSNPADETDYTYDPVHGGVLTETDPADAAGVRPQTRNTYTALYAKVLNSSGVPVNAEAPIYRLTRTSTCRTATTANPAACVGTANETVTTYTYNNNLLLASVTVAAGDNSITATTSYGYDDYGNRIWVDGPRTDVDDKSYTTYDLLRRPVYEISADPDGALSLKRTIVHHIYDVDGHEVRTETGSGNATDGSDFVMATYTAVTYDSYGNAVKTVVGQP